MDLRGKRALVMGLGVHGGGLGVARFLVDQGAEVTVTDLRDPNLLQSSLDRLAGLPIHWVLGKHRDEDFRAADLVIRNPAVPYASPYLQIARAAGATIEMEMTLFFRLCSGPILGITGTKGKTTTTLLTGAMLRQQYPDTVVAGNLGVSALEQLPNIGPDTPVVLELSSFVLEGLGEAKLSPQYACITNISPDHLDRYGSMEAYIDAKRQIFLYQNAQGVAVCNGNDRMSADLYESASSKLVWFFGANIEAPGPISSRYATAPVAYWQQDTLVWRLPSGEQEIICNKADVRLAGQHNLANIAAATALAKSFGVHTEHIRTAIGAFTGVEHRLELVRVLDGIRYVNDTTATAPDAAIAALRSFDAPIILIAGGADKNLPFEMLGQTIVGRAKAVVLLSGTATSKLRQAIEQAMPSVESISAVEARYGGVVNGAHHPTVIGPFDVFSKAIEAARGLAQSGDVVLLAPGSASFGMFRNEFHRGEEFRAIVSQLG